MESGRETRTHVAGDPQPARVERDVPIDRHTPAWVSRDAFMRPRTRDVRERKDVVDDRLVRRRLQRTALPVDAVKIDVRTAQLELCFFRGCGAVSASGEECILGEEKREVG